MFAGKAGAFRVLHFRVDPCGLYYNPITIVNDDARVINKLETHLLMLLELSFTITTCL
jgi:hypothetical protein